MLKLQLKDLVVGQQYHTKRFDLIFVCIDETQQYCNHPDFNLAFFNLNKGRVSCFTDSVLDVLIVGASE